MANAFIQSMATNQSPDALLQFIRKHRSSEGNFASILQAVNQEIESVQPNNPALAQTLEEVKEKYAEPYTKAKETGGSAWPEFEKLVTQLELALTSGS